MQIVYSYLYKVHYYQIDIYQYKLEFFHLHLIIITVSGTIFGSNLCWYSKKAASENQYKLRMSLFADSAKVRLDYNEKMMLIMKKYNMTQ